MYSTNKIIQPMHIDGANTSFMIWNLS